MPLPISHVGRSLWVVLLLGTVFQVSLTADETAPTKLKGLLITGGCCHDYERQTLILTEGLSQRVSISWDVVHEGDPKDRSYQLSVYNNPRWTRGYDIVVHNECFGSVEDVPFVEQIVRGHTETGVPAVVLHCSMHTYRAAATDEYRKLLGVTSRRHERGGRALEVKPAAKSHPIMTGFPASWTTPGDELYVIENLWPNCVPLAVAYGYFSVQDGVIVAKNSADNAPKVSTYLLTKKPYRNFRLVFEGKLVQSQMHSGIAIWGRKYEINGEPNSYQGHLVMFPTNWGFWDLYRRNSIYKDDGRARKADKIGDWNRMEILAIGSRIRLAVNGKEVADWTDPKPELCTAGPIGLQLHSNKVPQEVHFRGLILAEDPEDRLITVGGE